MVNGLRRYSLEIKVAGNRLAPCDLTPYIGHLLDVPGCQLVADFSRLEGKWVSAGRLLMIMG